MSSSKTAKVLCSISLCLVLLCTLSACVNQYSGARPAAALAGDQPLRIAATSPAVVSIMEQLNLDLVGVPSGNKDSLPPRYTDATELGAPMAPDMEIIKALAPDYVLSPASLISDLQPKYENLGVGYYFLNLRSVPGMFKSIVELGAKFNRQEQAAALVSDFESFYNSYRNRHAQAPAPSVLILMGLPGSYVVATENSYLGNLVALAGGNNVYTAADAAGEEFISVNTEDMAKRDPDIILRAAHALPDDVAAMFQKEFETNDIWRHFRAVNKAHVYDLSYERFGMSATLGYKEALNELEYVFYGSITQVPNRGSSDAG